MRLLDLSKHPFSWALFVPVLLLAGCPNSLEDQAAEARRNNDYSVAADTYRDAALERPCPDKARLYIEQAKMQELDNRPEDGLKSLGAAIRECPDYTESYWARAQRARDAGDREGAIADAGEIRDKHPEAAALYSQLSMEMQREEEVRFRAHDRILELRQLLDREVEDRELPKDRAATRLAGQIPVPVTLRYSVIHEMESPVVATVEWEEIWSYRGEMSDPTYFLVRELVYDTLGSKLPRYFRLTMDHLKLTMRFEVDHEANIVDASWLHNGPDRGMRPAMLRPEIQAMLKRRRDFEPGTEDQRGPGDRWSGADVRIVDGQPVELTYEAEAEAWVETLGIRTLRIRAKLTGEGYSGEEVQWIHPPTAVPVRWQRRASYSVCSSQGVGGDCPEYDRWDELKRGVLVSVSGVD